MDWKANSRGIPPPSNETSVQPQRLTETKCEQICTRKREITFAHFNPPVCSTLQNKSLRLCTVMRKVMYAERESWERGKNKNQRTFLARRFTTLVKCFYCCPSRSSSSKCSKAQG